MNETIPPIQPESPQVLQKMHDLAQEHFDDYLIVVMRDGKEWHTYKNKITAFGMASMISHEVNTKWYISDTKN